MKNENIYLHNMRLNLDNPDHLALHRCLMNVDTSLFRSKNEFIIKATMAGVEVMNEDIVKVLREQEVKLSEEQLNRLGAKVAGLLKAEVMDSIRIYNRRTWFRWSRRYESKDKGGSQIDFLITFAGYDVKEAVAWLLDFAGYRRMDEELKPKQLKKQAPSKEVKAKKPFVLPTPARNNSYLYSYLTNERGISKKIVDKFVEKGLIYESKEYHNIVFKGLDANGICHFASMRGVFDGKGKPFKCDVEGNNKNYGFNIRNTDSTEVIVFEGAIDLMSYMDIYSDFDSNMIALGMVADAPLETFLKENPHIGSIRFCLNNDEPGRKATEALMKKYYESGFDVEDCPPPKSHNDYNDWLREQKCTTRAKSDKKEKVM